MFNISYSFDLSYSKYSEILIHLIQNVPHFLLILFKKSKISYSSYSKFYTFLFILFKMFHISYSTQ